MMNALKKARRTHRMAVEQLYEDTCTVYEYVSEKDTQTKLTAKKEVAVLEDEPCRLSFNSTTVTSESNGAPGQFISIKLFISPEAKIKPGSKIAVTHQGETVLYSNSGVPGKYETHQEIPMKLFERWA